MEFQIVGSRPHLRTEEELALVDKTAADAAFKRYKKEILDPCMGAQGFLKYKGTAYVRKNKIDLLEYIGLQKERYGSKTFTVNLAVMPLYIPHEAIVFNISRRLGGLIANRDVWWDFAEDAVCKRSMDNVKAAVERFAMPWFHEWAEESYVMGQLLRQKQSARISARNQEWLDALDRQTAQTAIIRENIERLKLPRGLMR